VHLISAAQATVETNSSATTAQRHRRNMRVLLWVLREKRPRVAKEPEVCSMDEKCPAEVPQT
jgi:hypothetical protein